MTDPMPAAPGAAAAHDISADADMSADLLMALLGEDGAMAALAAEGPADPAAAFTAGKKEIRSRVKQLAAERPEFLAKIITHWLKEERFKGR
ncbi:MAG: hypothetical protein AAB152_07605 [Candidatus Coatesbacteria bacterium]